MNAEQLMRLERMKTAIDAEIFRAYNDIHGWQNTIARANVPSLVYALEKAIEKRTRDIEAMEERKRRLIEDSRTWQN